MENRYWYSEGQEPKVLLTSKWFGTKYTLWELFEMTEVFLGIFPKEKFKLVFCKDASEVRSIYRARYGKELASHSFISRSDMTAWFSLKDITARVFVHESAHLLFESNLKKRVSYDLHEAVAQLAEREVLK